MKSKKFRFLITFIMVIAMVSTMSASAFAFVKIGYANISESNKINGKRGDSTGREVYMREWFDKDWNLCLRPIDPELADKSALACEAGCANDNIGYGQADRNSAYEFYLKVGDVSKIGKSNTDTAAFMTLCAIAGGCSELNYKGNAPSTNTIRKCFVQTGKYMELTEKKYLTTDRYLKRGDILVREGKHAIMILSDGDRVENDSLGAGAKEYAQEMLMLKAITKDKNAINLSWDKIKGAKKYNIYGAKFNNEFKKIATVKNTKFTVNKVLNKKLKSHKIYKFYVAAKGKSNKSITNSDTVACITANTTKKYANVKSITKKVKELNLKVDDPADITEYYKCTMYNGKKHLPDSYGMPVRYFSSNTLVADVDYQGKLTAYGPGTAKIYIRDVSGKYRTITVNVTTKDIDGPEYQ